MINISKDFFIVAISAIKHFQFFTVVARRGVVQHEARGREEAVHYEGERGEAGRREDQPQTPDHPG